MIGTFIRTPSENFELHTPDVDKMPSKGVRLKQDRFVPEVHRVQNVLNVAMAWRPLKCEVLGVCFHVFGAIFCGFTLYDSVQTDATVCRVVCVCEVPLVTLLTSAALFVKSYDLIVWVCFVPTASVTTL